MTLLSSWGNEVFALQGLGPLDVMARWPETTPAAWLAGSGDDRRARWTILGIPSGRVERTDPMRVLDEHSPVGLSGGAESGLPFVGGWIGWLSYELGERIEPSVTRGGGDGPEDDRGWPVCHLVRCDAALVHDGRTGVWHAAGDGERCGAFAREIASAAARERGFRVGRLTSVTGRRRYERDVARVVGLIHAGDAFQVNLAHRLSGVFEGCARAMFVEVARSLRPWYGAFVEMRDADGSDGLGGAGGAVCSVSPELFLRVDGRTRRVETRPMKGTRPAGGAAGAGGAWGAGGAAALRGSEKDRAELAMIVDLMRNDLGRVCGYGSVRVDEAQGVEMHHGRRGGVMQGVATVSGVLREGVGMGEVMRAAFPPGSVTGAPKVRAMQIIRELEPVARGPYCGAVGYVSDCGSAQWSVAIRTAALRLGNRSGAGRAEGTIDYAVGAGIVADSLPGAEWRETLVKAAAFRGAVRAGRG